MAGSGVRDERVNDQDGFMEGGSASDTAMDDLNPDAQPQASSSYHTMKVTQVDVRHKGESNGRIATHRDGWQWCARRVCYLPKGVQGWWQCF